MLLADSISAAKLKPSVRDILLHAVYAGLECTQQCRNISSGHFSADPQPGRTTSSTEGCDPQLFLYASASSARLSAVELQDVQRGPHKNKAAACHTKAKIEGVFVAAVGTFEHAMKASIPPVLYCVMYHGHLPIVYLTAVPYKICDLARGTS